MAVYYFSTSGSDTFVSPGSTNTGGQDSPFASLAKMNSLIAAHTTGSLTILLKGGDTFTFTSEITITSKNSVNFATYGTGTSTISFSTGSYCFNIFNSTNISIDNLTLTASSTITTRAINMGTGSLSVSNCVINGFGVGVYATNTGLIATNVHLNNPFIAGFALTNGNAILTECQCRDASVRIVGLSRTARDLSSITVNIPATLPYGEDKGAALRLIGTAYAVVNRCRFIDNIRAIYTVSTSPTATRIYRSWIDFGFGGDENTGIESANFTGNTTPIAGIVVRDSIFKIGAYSLPCAKAMRVVTRTSTGSILVTNCTVVSNTSNAAAAIFNNEPGSGAGSFIVKNTACLIRVSGGADHYFVRESAGVASGAQYKGYNNNYGYAEAAPATTPFIIGVTTYSRSSWATFGRESNFKTVQFDTENLTSFTEDLARIRATNGLVNAGLDLTTEYTTENVSPIDYYGTNRSQGFSGYWSIGVHEPSPRPTVQAFTEGSSIISLTSPAGVTSFAVYQEVTNSSAFPKQSHSVETLFTYTGNLSSVGVFLLSDRIPDIYTTNIGGYPPGVIYTDSATIIPDIYTGSPARSLTTTDYWRIGQTPGAVNSNRVVFSIKKVGSDFFVDLAGPGFSSGYQITGSNGITVPAAGTSIGLKMEAILLEQTAESSLYSFACWISYNSTNLARNWVLAISDVRRSFTDAYLSNAKHSGIYGLRASTVDTLTWSQLITRITDTTAPIVENPGVARYKEFLSGRESVTNLIANGGFTNYPSTIQTVVKSRFLKKYPSISRGTPEVPVHIAFVFEASNKWGRSHIEYIKETLLSFLDNCPRDGTVIITATSHAENGDNGIGLAAEHVGEDCLITETSYPGIRERIVAMAPVSAVRSAWITGFGLDERGRGGPIIVQDFETGPGLIPCFLRGANNQLGAYVGAKKIAVLINASIPFPNAKVSGAFLKSALFQNVEGITDVIALSTASDNLSNAGDNVATTATKFRSVLYPDVPQAGSYTAGVHYNDAPIPDGLKAVVLSTRFHTQTTSTAPQIGLHEAAVQVGKDLDAIVRKRIAQYFAVNGAPETEATINLPVKVLTKIPGISSSVSVSASKADESLLGEWSVYGCLGAVDINPQLTSGRMISYDGGNVARVTFSESGNIRLVQRVVDIKPLLGRWITLAYSGHRVKGRVMVSLIISVDGAETVLDSIPSTSFGQRLRRVSSYELPLNFSTLDVIISIQGTASDSVGLSAVAMALGRYEKDLPFSFGDASAIPSGTVIMYTGPNCPAGYRTVPYSKDRLALGIASNPYELSVDRGVPSVIKNPEASNVDVVIMIDAGASMFSRPGLFDSVVTNVIARCPTSISASLSVVLTNEQRPGEIIFPLSDLSDDPVALTNTFRNSVSFRLPQTTAAYAGIPPAKNIVAGLEMAQSLLSNSSSPNKLFYYITDLSYTRSAQMLAVFNSITQIVGVLNVSCIVPAAVVGTNATSMIYPPSVGEVIVDSSGVVAYEKILAQIQLASERQISVWDYPEAYNSAEPPYLGGQVTHDHVSGVGAGASIDDGDGFEPSTDGVVQTSVRIPRESAVTMRAFPYGSQANSNRSGDRPVYAIGSRHRHGFNSEMTAMPPSFPIIFCEKL